MDLGVDDELGRELKNRFFERRVALQKEGKPLASHREFAIYTRRCVMNSGSRLLGCVAATWAGGAPNC